MSEVKEVLNERGSRYGTLKENGAISQALKKVVRIVPGWDRLGDDQREAIDNIFQKISRALSGDPNYADNWLDIEGYSNLVRTEIEGKKVEPEVRKEEKDVTVESGRSVTWDLFDASKDERFQASPGKFLRVRNFPKGLGGYLLLSETMRPGFQLSMHYSSNHGTRYFDEQGIEYVESD